MKQVDVLLLNVWPWCDDDAPTIWIRMKVAGMAHVACNTHTHTIDRLCRMSIVWSKNIKTVKTVIIYVRIGDRPQSHLINFSLLLLANSLWLGFCCGKTRSSASPRIARESSSSWGRVCRDDIVCCEWERKWRQRRWTVKKWKLEHWLNTLTRKQCRR